MDVVVLVSGGIDSIVVCKLIEKQGDSIYPLFIDYGQLAAKKEWEACQQLLSDCSFPKAEKMDVSGFGRVIPSGLTDRTKDIQSPFLPCRNLLFLTLAASYAHTKGCKAIAIGLLNEKSHLFPDQTEAFIVNANFAINSALDDNFIILTPLIQFSKSDVIKLAEKYSIPLQKTYSCHSGEDVYCGKCVSCKEILASGEKEKIKQFGEGD